MNEDLRTQLLKLADEWERRIAVAYTEYMRGERDAYELAARELREKLEGKS